MWEHIKFWLAKDIVDLSLAIAVLIICILYVWFSEDEDDYGQGRF